MLICFTGLKIPICRNLSGIKQNAGQKKCVQSSHKALALIMRYIHYKLESSSTLSAALKTLLRFSGHGAAEFAPAAADCQISCHVKSNWKQFDTSLSLCSMKMVNNPIKCSPFLIKALEIHLKFTASSRPKLVITPAPFPPLHTQPSLFWV